MFTLVYIRNQFNRPDTLLPFLRSNIGQSPLLRIDCITPYQGTPQDLINEVCNYLSSVDPEIEVAYNVTRTASTDGGNPQSIEFLEIQINVTQRN